MRVLLLADAASTHVQKWALSLANKNVSLCIFSLSSADPGLYKESPNIQLFTPNNFGDLGLREVGSLSKLSYLKTLLALRKCIKAFSPDIVHAHYASSYGLLGALCLFKPFFISAWGTDIFEFPRKSFLHRWVLKFNLRSANQIFSTSHIMAVEMSYYTTKNVRVIPFGIDLEKFKPAKGRKLFDDDSIVIGIIKTLEDRYGVSYLINAFAILKKNRNEKLKLLIVGKGSKEWELKNLVAKLGLIQDVHFAGWVLIEEVSSFHNSIDIAVFPSEADSFGVSILEAGACGKPVIVSRVGGLVEVVEENKTGLIIPPRDPEALAEAIALLLDNKEMRESLGGNGRIWVQKHYDWHENVGTMFQAYSEYIKQRERLPK
jgi:glycosyltransferase involved in cell wall biosynthesis